MKLKQTDLWCRDKIVGEEVRLGEVYFAIIPEGLYDISSRKRFDGSSSRDTKSERMAFSGDILLRKKRNVFRKITRSRKVNYGEYSFQLPTPTRFTIGICMIFFEFKKMSFLQVPPRASHPREINNQT